MLSILIVNDSPKIVQHFTHILSKNGYKVLAAGDGETGIKVAKEELPRIIFMDVVLPGINGFNTTKAIKKTNHLSHIIIIGMIDKKSEVDRRWMARLGARGFIDPKATEDEVMELFSRLGIQYL